MIHLHIARELLDKIITKLGDPTDLTSNDWRNTATDLRRLARSLDSTAAFCDSMIPLAAKK